MGLGSLGSSILSDANGIVGNIDKAVLIFPEPKKKIKINLEDNMTGNSLGTEGKLQNVKMQMEDVTDTFVGSTLKKGMADKIQGQKFTVQFNPSSIRMSARGGGRVPVSNFVKDENGVTKATVEFKELDPYISVSFTLIFDAFNQADAFMEERFTLGATTLAKNVATAAITGAGKEFSVRPVVEGFLAAIRDEDHRNMIFQWGKLTYAGVLNSVSGKYTMFNTKGEPIRAEINISMLMGGAEGSSSSNAGYLYYWKKRYKEIINDNAKMDGDNASSMDLGTVKQQFSNLLNL